MSFNLNTNLIAPKMGLRYLIQTPTLAIYWDSLA